MMGWDENGGKIYRQNTTFCAKIELKKTLDLDYCSDIIIVF